MRGSTFPRHYSNFRTKPHWNYVSIFALLPTISFKLTFFQLIKSAVKNFGHTPRGYPLRPRNRGPLLTFEKSPSYQVASRFCIDSRPAPYSIQSLVCSGVVDFGISALIESQILQDLLTCVAAGNFLAHFLGKVLITFFQLFQANWLETIWLALVGFWHECMRLKYYRGLWNLQDSTH